MIKFLLGVAFGFLLALGVVNLNVNWDKANQVKTQVQQEIKHVQGLGK